MNALIIGASWDLTYVEDFDRYYVTKDWNVYSTGFTSRVGNFIKRILKLTPAIDKDWYKVVCLYKSRWDKKNFKVSRLIALAFIDNPKNKPDVNHIDWNKLNNNVNNLEWCTKSENMLHSYHKLWNKTPNHWAWKKNPNLRKKVFQYTKDMNLIKIWDCQKDVFKNWNFSRSWLDNILNWKTKLYKGFIFLRENSKGI